jgi:hypothetical protein
LWGGLTEHLGRLSAKAWCAMLAVVGVGPWRIYARLWLCHRPLRERSRVGETRSVRVGARTAAIFEQEVERGTALGATDSRALWR